MLAVVASARACANLLWEEATLSRVLRTPRPCGARPGRILLAGASRMVCVCSLDDAVDPRVTREGTIAGEPARFPVTWVVGPTWKRKQKGKTACPRRRGTAKPSGRKPVEARMAW